MLLTQRLAVAEVEPHGAAVPVAYFSFPSQWWPDEHVLVCVCMPRGPIKSAQGWHRERCREWGAGRVLCSRPHPAGCSSEACFLPLSPAGWESLEPPEAGSFPSSCLQLGHGHAGVCGPVVSGSASSVRWGWAVADLACLWGHRAAEAAWVEEGSQGAMALLCHFSAFPFLNEGGSG